MPRHFIIVGCGYTGLRLARLAISDGFAVTGLARTAAGGSRISASGATALCRDLEAGELPTLTQTAGAAVAYLIPPGVQTHTDPALIATLAALDAAGLPERFVYLSTTGVYGDCAGAWIDESRPPAPVTERSRRRLAAERLVTDWTQARGIESATLRVAAIYGPGRLPLERLRRRQPAIHPAECAFGNRIHVDDLATVLLAAACRPTASRLYNIADGHPCTYTDYLLRVAELAGLPSPPLISARAAETELGPGILSFLSESRRIDNRLMLRELGIHLRYPSFEQGVAASLTAGDGSGIEPGQGEVDWPGVES